MNSCDSSTSFGSDFGVFGADFGADFVVFGADFRVFTVFGSVLYSLEAS